MMDAYFIFYIFPGLLNVLYLSFRKLKSSLLFVMSPSCRATETKPCSEIQNFMPISSWIRYPTSHDIMVIMGVYLLE